MIIRIRNKKHTVKLFKKFFLKKILNYSKKDIKLIQKQKIIKLRNNIKSVFDKLYNKKYLKRKKTCNIKSFFDKKINNILKINNKI